MAERILISKYSGKITSVKVLPFTGPGPVQYEITQTAQLTGELSGHAIGSNYVRAAPDGTSVTRFYGILTTEEMETVFLESSGMSVPIGAGRSRYLTTVTHKTSSERLQWVNTAIMTFEGEGDFSSMEIAGNLYHWK